MFLKEFVNLKLFNIGNKVLLLVLVGVFVRIVLSLSTYHPDLSVFQFSGQLVASGNILNIYDYQSSLPGNDPLTKMFVLNYPPAIYLLHGSFNFVISRVLGLSLINQFLIINPSDYGNWQFNIHLLLLKIPYFLFDFLSLILLLKFFSSRKEKMFILLLWLFNPINLYATYMVGQFDIIPTFFTILSLFFARQNKLGWGAFALGMGAVFKIYPLFLLIPLVFFGKSWLERAKLLVIGLLPYVLFILPYIHSHGFRSTALVANQTLKSLYAAIPISGGESILLFPMLLIFFYLAFFYIKSNIKVLWQQYFLVLLLFFILTHYHPQWLLWLTPFIAIELVTSKFKHIILMALILVSYTALLFFFDPSLTITMFTPAFPALLNLPDIWSLLKIPVDNTFGRSIFQTIFVAAAAYYIYLYFPRKEGNPH